MNQSNKIKDPNKTANASDNSNQPNASCPVSCIITSQTVKKRPPINPARTRIGAGEEVDLTVSPGPAKWTATPNGLIELPADAATNAMSSIRIKALDKAGNVTIKAKTATCECSITLTIVLPSGCYMEPVPDTPLIHVHGQPCCGWFGRLYILPKDVIFYNIWVRELDDKFIGKGCFKDHPDNGVYHGKYRLPDRASAWHRVTDCAPNKGSFSLTLKDNIVGANYDAINRSPPPRFRDGTLETPIRFQWTINRSGNKHHDFEPFRQKTIVDGNGRCITSKGGYTAISELNDPTTGFNFATGQCDPTIK